jgi:hypothetical protein
VRDFGRRARTASSGRMAPRPPHMIRTSVGKLSVVGTTRLCLRSFFAGPERTGPDHRINKINTALRFFAAAFLFFVGRPGWVRSSGGDLALLIDRENDGMGAPPTRPPATFKKNSSPPEAFFRPAISAPLVANLQASAREHDACGPGQRESAFSLQRQIASSLGRLRDSRP